MNQVRQMARGMIDKQTTLIIASDGTFTTHVGFGKKAPPDRLLGFDHDVDSMRRKSASGRGGAALATGGLSLLASNNRGVIYVTLHGERTGVRTFTTRNPSGTVLTSVRELKAAADALLATTVPEPSGGDVATQLQKLADLHASGALSAQEFAAAKNRLLG